MFNKITEGLIRAVMLVAQHNQRTVKPKFNYISMGSSPHLAQSFSALTEEQKKLVTGELKHELPSNKIKLVPAKYAERIDRSRYTGEKLREIRKVGGAREKARRLARMVSAEAPLLVAAE